GDLTVDENEAIYKEFQDKLQVAIEHVKAGPPRPVGMRGHQGGAWKGLSSVYSHAAVDTAVPFDALQEITEGLARVPPDFTAHPKIVRQLEARVKELAERHQVDWSFAEALAFGSLLLDGTPVRLSGQDSRRGTFSQRHSVLYDARTGAPYS